MIFVAAGIVLYLVASMIDYREYRALIPYIYGGIIVLLIAVFFFPERNGAQRWIELGLFDLQPAEVAKIVVVLGIARSSRPEPGRAEGPTSPGRRSGS